MVTYYAVIFTSKRTEKDESGYGSMSVKIEELVSRFLDLFVFGIVRECVRVLKSIFLKILFAILNWPLI